MLVRRPSWMGPFNAAVPTTMPTASARNTAMIDTRWYRKSTTVQAPDLRRGVQRTGDDGVGASGRGGVQDTGGDASRGSDRGQR